MALKINNPQRMLFTPDDRVLRDVNRVWLKPYFPDGDIAQVTCDFEERTTIQQETIDPVTKEISVVEINNDVIKGSIVINVAINLGAENFVVYFHQVCIAALNEIFPNLEFEIVAI